ncbi:TetR/AcrR family transcriptional regulator [Paracoccus sp. DMF-8]|uniref:TetR/AcrR family transcriptional regulator n=1 Tax=Paracoccus sp. DMF-8 TaxID=3019445 RepID=UPI0023E41517|nr:TetR/AcrR family transcriptional regulator [Paracoccus sp. DMF-8]MDF3607590.1 TetR/AcrR family transcriptional regulator [Paracoccus sp. DMF-8]
MARPQRLPREELRQAILDAAQDILRDEGVDALTARAIAKRVGYTAASIYNVFESMSDLLIEVNRRTLTDLRLIFVDLPESAPPDVRLKELLRRYIAFMQRNPALWAALFGGTRKRESFPDWYTASVRFLLGQLRDMLREVTGETDDARAWAQAEQLYLAVHGAISLDLGRRLDLVTPQPLNHVTEAILDMMLARFRT